MWVGGRGVGGQVNIGSWTSGVGWWAFVLLWSEILGRICPSQTCQGPAALYMLPYNVSLHLQGSNCPFSCIFVALDDLTCHITLSWSSCELFNSFLAKWEEGKASWESVHDPCYTWAMSHDLQIIVSILGDYSLIILWREKCVNSKVSTDKVMHTLLLATFPCLHQSTNATFHSNSSLGFYKWKCPVSPSNSPKPAL